MKKMLLFILCASLWVSCKKAETAETESPADATAQPAEFADASTPRLARSILPTLRKETSMA